MKYVVILGDGMADEPIARLDGKTPLLRSMELIDREALRIVRLFGNTAAKKVTVSVGADRKSVV